MVCLPNRDRPYFNPSPHSTVNPTAMDLKTALESVGFVTEIKDSFPIDDRRYEGWLPVVFRRLAVRFHLLPPSTPLQAGLKRFVYFRFEPLAPPPPNLPSPPLQPTRST